MLMNRPHHSDVARLTHVVSVAATVQIAAWAVTMFLMARAEDSAALAVLLTAQSLLMIATICYAVYLYGK
jgi:hypothetical protein